MKRYHGRKFNFLLAGVASCVLLSGPAPAAPFGLNMTATPDSAIRLAQSNQNGKGAKALRNAIREDCETEQGRERRNAEGEPCPEAGANENQPSMKGPKAKADDRPNADGGDSRSADEQAQPQEKPAVAETPPPKPEQPAKAENRRKKQDAEAAEGQSEPPAGGTQPTQEASPRPADESGKSAAEKLRNEIRKGKKPESEAGRKEPAAESESSATAGGTETETEGGQTVPGGRTTGPGAGSLGAYGRNPGFPVDEGTEEGTEKAEQPKPDVSGKSATDRLRETIGKKRVGETDVVPSDSDTAGTADSREAPLTDSAKEDAAEAPARQKGQRAKADDRKRPENEEANVVEAEELPQSDADAQTEAVIGEKIESVQAESGRAVDNNVRFRHQFDQDEIVARIGDRIVININGTLVVRYGDDRHRRLYDRYDDVVYEELRGGRLRETITRRDGTLIVTIYNRYGEILRRSRITPDGREIILVYVPRDRWDYLDDRFYDPGRDLPPLRLAIPRREYIFEYQEASADDYYSFLSRPPVERVERLYSIEEVKRSARIRDKARRIDLVSINFEFGSAEISESEVDELEALANAMNRLLEENPGEQFLLEGHTDAVGSDEANLVLSDRRAESVAEVLTEYFNVPPENMVTQGYGERYLKIRTEAAERENRRVAVRRITPLVSPANVQAMR